MYIGAPITAICRKSDENRNEISLQYTLVVRKGPIYSSSNKALKEACVPNIMTMNS
jgi:hypothetical protein